MEPTFVHNPRSPYCLQEVFIPPFSNNPLSLAPLEQNIESSPLPNIIFPDDNKQEISESKLSKIFC